VRRRILTIALAALLAVFGVVAVLGYVREANTRAIAGQKAVTVLVAQSAIPAGTQIGSAVGDGSLTSEKEPASSVPSEAVHSISGALTGRVTSVALSPGQLLLAPMLVSPGTRTASSFGVALAVPPGDVAVTMEMCLDADVAGFVQPGSYVTVFDTMSTGGSIQYNCTSHQPPQKGAIIAGVVVPRVLVLSVTTAKPQSTSSVAGQVVADPSNPGSQVSTTGELLVTLAATSQAEADHLVALTTAGDPTFGLLTKGVTPTVDPQFFPQTIQR
jgi:pilus assembly protein CpaB